ncbi:hypothetical protein ACWGLG_11635 [Streptomyces antimycoticus]
MTWSPAGLTCAATTGDPAADQQRHRDSLAATVRRAFAPRRHGRKENNARTLPVQDPAPTT